MRARVARRRRTACSRKRRGAARSTALGRPDRVRRLRRPHGRGGCRRALPPGSRSRRRSAAPVAPHRGQRGDAGRSMLDRAGDAGSRPRRSAPGMPAVRRATDRTGRPLARAQAPRPERGRRAVRHGPHTVAPHCARAVGGPRSGDAAPPVQRSQLDGNRRSRKKKDIYRKISYRRESEWVDISVDGRTDASRGERGQAGLPRCGRARARGSSDSLRIRRQRHRHARSADARHGAGDRHARSGRAAGPHRCRCGSGRRSGGAGIALERGFNSDTTGSIAGRTDGRPAGGVGRGARAGGRVVRRHHHWPGRSARCTAGSRGFLGCGAGARRSVPRSRRS